jgi:hypothetical protein
MTLEINPILKLVLVVCLVFLVVYLFRPKPSIQSVKRIKDKQKYIENTPDEYPYPGPDCKPNVGQLCPGGFPCPQTGKCPDCKEALTIVCGDEKNKGPDQCTQCVQSKKKKLLDAGCALKSIEKAKKEWCTQTPIPKCSDNPNETGYPYKFCSGWCNQGRKDGSKWGCGIARYGNYTCDCQDCNDCAG